METGLIKRRGRKQPSELQESPDGTGKKFVYHSYIGSATWKSLTLILSLLRAQHAALRFCRTNQARSAVQVAGSGDSRECKGPFERGGLEGIFQAVWI